MKRKIAAILTATLCILIFTGCSSVPPPKLEIKNSSIPYYKTDDVLENSFVSTDAQTESFFSLDRNTASYSLMRRQVNQGVKIDKNSVRIEEFVNYFDYSYLKPECGEALAVSGKLFDCPWNEENKLFTIGIAAEEIDFTQSKRNNLVFLIDVSGSMFGEDRLGLIQQSFVMLANCLSVDDTISIVTYANGVQVALDGESGSEKTKIAGVLQDLTASGSTSGSGGLQLAYDTAEKHFSSDANNRIILATDGDFNVGISDKNELKNFISEKRDLKNIYLSVLGVGAYNTDDTVLKSLAENGNGNYSYLDSITEARKVLVKEMGGTLITVAKNAKISVKFNAETVSRYRLIGYESKTMSQEEFEDAQKDAGEIGSGHTVTAVYELTLKQNASGKFAETVLRYNESDGAAASKEIKNDFSTANNCVYDEDAAFIGCVTEFGLLLRRSQYMSGASFGAVINRLEKLECVSGEYKDAFKEEFLSLVRKAAALYV